MSWLVPAPDRAAAARRGAVDPRRAVAARPAGHRRHRPRRRSSSSSVVLLVDVDRDGTLVAEAGGWPAPIGITLVADRFAAMLLRRRRDRCCSPCWSTPSASRAPSATTSASSRSTWCSPPASPRSFLTGDLFNLFVAFEMMLTASYVLLTLGGRREQVRSGMTYVVISLSRRRCSSPRSRCSTRPPAPSTWPTSPAGSPSSRRACARAFAVLLLVVFGIKAALFPLFFWLPDSYPTAPSPITAVFAGLLTKVGVYAIIRTQTLLFPDDTRPATLLLVSPAATMVVGVLGAIAQDDVKRILSFTIVSQIGYMVMGLGLLHRRRPRRGRLLDVHHIVVKTAPVPRRRAHRARRRLEPAQPARRHGPHRAAARRAVPRPGAQPRRHPAAVGVRLEVRARRRRLRRRTSTPIVAVSLVVSLLTLFSMIRIWTGVFWSPPEDEPTAAAPARRASRAAGPSDGRARPRSSSPAAWRSPPPPGRSTRSASAPRTTCSTATATSRRCCDR